MDEKEQDHVAAFDMLFTTNRIQIMKALLPCFDNSIRKHLAIFIKYQELQYTISYFKNHPLQTNTISSGRKADIRKLLPTILPYCDDSQKQKIRQFEQLMSSMETYREMMEMMETMKEMSGFSDLSDMFGGNTGTNEGNSMPDMEMLLSLLGPEQQGILDLLKGGFSHE